MSRRSRLALAAGLLVMLCLAGLGLAAWHGDRGPAAAQPSRTAGPSPRPAGALRARPSCPRPAPNTAAGYARMFTGLDPAQWGAADGWLSTPLPDGRTLWLFGDTFSTGRFAHSTGIVQDRGCLHVVNAGAQLIPNADAHHIFWIQTATATTAHGPTTAVSITARAVTLTGTGPWDFTDGGYSQRFLLHLTSTGDTTPATAGLTRPASGRIRTPPPDPGPLYPYGPHHFGYGRRIHHDIRLANDHYLVTTCQNWDDNTLHPYAQYLAIFTDTPR